jgi:outer membrane protein OmpA-like peptidoglycan-associated protein
LSERRARAIAAWFRRRGFTGPVSYQGFGETALAVPTPDETDEAANRRALYILAANPPPVSEQLPARAWKPLD